MGTWNSPPQIPPFKQPPYGSDQEQLQQASIEYLKQLANIVSQMKNDLEFMLNGTLDANNIRAEGIEAKNIKANTITADKMDVNELSAISANLGHITAGLIESIQIFGSYIATRNGSYPRAEMSNSGNLFGAYLTAGNGIEIKPAGWNDVPAVSFSRSGVSSFISFPVNFTIDSETGVTINARLNSINLRTQGLGSYVNVDDWSRLRNENTGQTMQQALDALQTSIGALWTYTAGLDARITALGG